MTTSIDGRAATVTVIPRAGRRTSGRDLSLCKTGLSQLA